MFSDGWGEAIDGLPEYQKVSKQEVSQNRSRRHCRYIYLENLSVIPLFSDLRSIRLKSTWFWK